LRRPTALKVLPASHVDVLALARFEREVQATSELHHPNTIVIYDYGRADDGSFFYAMEYLEGLDLDELVASYGPLPEARVVHFLMQACGSLAEAHERGMVHRDVKPSNLFVCNRPGVFDLVKVLDFGIVKHDQAADRPITRSSTIMGTPEFMSPEMFDQARQVGTASDLYSLGATAYYLLTAKPVFDATTLAEACSAHLMQQPLRPSQQVGREIEPGLEAVVLACLEKSPDKRPSSAGHLLDLLCALPSAKTWTQTDAALFWKSVTSNPAPPRSWSTPPPSAPDTWE
jgi:serine/threonine-protein kinase